MPYRIRKYVYWTIIMIVMSQAFLFWQEPWDNAQMRHAKRLKLKTMVEVGEIDANEQYKLQDVQELGKSQSVFDSQQISKFPVFSVHAAERYIKEIKGDDYQVEKRSVEKETNYKDQKLDE